MLSAHGEKSLNNIIGLFFLIVSLEAFAHTWDEPWHKEVVAGADTFGLYEVTSNSGFSLKLKLIKHLAGEKHKKKVKVTKYYLFDWTSKPSDLDDHPFEYSKGEKLYAFLKKDGRNFGVATPTSGISIFLDDGSVLASYRHSIHGTKSEIHEYELLQTCIFNALHNSQCSEKAISLVKEYLKASVGFLSETATEDDVMLFFRQHAALETSYLAKIDNSIEILRPFLESNFFHVQAGAVRALAGSSYSNKESELLSFASSEGKDGMARVMAIILLNEFPSVKTVNFMSGYLNAAPEDEVYLGASSIMDPRIGTWYPESVKAAVEWYLTENKALNNSIQPSAEASAD